MAASMKQKISDFIAGAEDDVSKSVANEINKTNAKFLDFIECLGQPLTGSSNDTVTRGRATKLIGDVLTLLPPSFLSKEHAQVVATFLVAKLSDHHSVQPSALHSLAVLTSRCSPLPEGLPSQICLTIFREIQNQSLSQADRRSNYLIFQNLLASSNKELERMGGDFVIGFIQQMDSEKDPRNLLLVFNCAHHVIATVPLGAFTEEIFEVLGCYFPIDFVPPPNNPYGVTKEELIVALRKCFAGSPDFAPFCLPLLLEKMTSDLQSARLDAIETFTECAPIYGKKGLTEFMGSITSALRREILMDISADLVQISRQALTAVFKQMVPAQGINSSQDESVTTSMVEIYQDIHKFLEGSNSNRVCLAFSVCRAIASSSPTAFLTVVPLALPSLIKACRETEQENEKILFLKEINCTLHLLKTLSFSKDEKEKLSLTEPVCDLYENMLASNCSQDVSAVLVKGITCLMTVEGLISTQRSSSFVKSLVHLGLTTEDKSSRKHILVSTRECLVANRNLSEETINSISGHITSTENRCRAFDSLSYAATNTESFNKISSILLSIVFKPLEGGEWSGTEVVQSLCSLVETQEPSSPTIGLMVQTLAIPLMRASVMLCHQWTEETKDKCQQFVSACRDIYRLVANRVKQSDAATLWNKFYLVMLEGNTSCIDCVGDTELKPLQDASPWQQTTLIALLEGFLSGVHIHAIAENREAMFEALFSLTRSSNDEFTHQSACHCVAIILNKATLGSQIHWLLEPIKDQLMQALETPGDEARRFRCLNVWIWITKALECRGHSAAGIFSSKLVSLVDDPELGREAACGLGVLFEDFPSLLSLPLHSNVTPMYKQRVFTLNFKTLLEGYEKSKANTTIKQHYLLAFSRITSNLPQQVLKPHLDKLVPLLLISLDQLSGPSQHSALTTLTNAVLYTPETIGKSVDSLVPRLIAIARNDSKMNIRIAALKCLENMADLPAHSVAPHQPKVVRELAATLGDKKRLVRMQAVETRNAWILTQDIGQ